MMTNTKRDYQAILDVVAGMSSAWKAGDAAAIADFYAKDADHTIWTGRYLKGRGVIRESHQQIFNTIYKDTEVEKTVKAIRFITHDVCLVHLESKIVALNGNKGSAMLARPLLVLKRHENDRWLIETAHNTPVVKDGVIQGLGTPAPSGGS